eukprot:ctg_528.g256
MFEFVCNIYPHQRWKYQAVVDGERLWCVQRRARDSLSTTATPRLFWWNHARGRQSLVRAANAELVGRERDTKVTHVPVRKGQGGSKERAENRRCTEACNASRRCQSLQVRPGPAAAQPPANLFTGWPRISRQRRPQKLAPPCRPPPQRRWGGAT